VWGFLLWLDKRGLLLYLSETLHKEHFMRAVLVVFFFLCCFFAEAQSKDSCLILSLAPGWVGYTAETVYFDEEGEVYYILGEDSELVGRIECTDFRKAIFSNFPLHQVVIRGIGEFIFDGTINIVEVPQLKEKVVVFFQGTDSLTLYQPMDNF
jgi:hypothetical protein